MPAQRSVGYPNDTNGTSGFGTERTNRAGLAMSVVGGKAEAAFQGREDRF